MKIITHGGTSHRDELIACSIALVLDPGINIIERRAGKITDKEYEDPETYIIDVGRRYEPDLNNFDHHQDKGLPCSMRLVARKFGLDEKSMEYLPWYSFTDEADRKGFYNTLEEHGVDPDLSDKLKSPMETVMLSQFGKVEFIAGRKSNNLMSLLIYLGTYISNYVTNVSDLVENLKNDIEIVQIPGTSYKIIVLTERNGKIRHIVNIIRSRHPDKDNIIMSAISRGHDKWILYKYPETDYLFDFPSKEDDSMVLWNHVERFLIIYKGSLKDLQLLMEQLLKQKESK